MNFSEFRRWLNSEPASQDADYQAARRSAPEFIQAAADSDEFERKMQHAMRLETPAGLGDSLKAIALQSTTQKSTNLSGEPRFKWGYAIAASLLLVVSAVLLKQQFAPGYDSVEDYVAYHFAHDGQKYLGQAGQPENTAPDAAEISRMLATVDLQMLPSMSAQVRFVKFCPTPEGRGIHLVMATEQGPVTVLIMPGQRVQDGELMAFDGMAASLVSLPGSNASAAVIGRPEQLNAAFSLALQDAVLPRGAGA